MKFSELNTYSRERLRAKLSAQAKKHGFKSGKDHPNYRGGIKTSREGYVSVLIGSKYIKRARLVMAEYIGRYLKPNEIAHHINGIRDDDRIENLRLFDSNSSHTKHHHKLRKLSKLMLEA